MYQETFLSAHINELKSLMRQLREIKAQVEEDDAKAILLNSLSSNYDNTIFTLSQLSTKSLDEMIAALLAEENRLKQGNQDVHPQDEIVLFLKGRFNKNKSTIECFYCKRRGHTSLNCIICASDLLKGKVKESANIAIYE